MASNPPWRGVLKREMAKLRMNKRACFFDRLLYGTSSGTFLTPELCAILPGFLLPFLSRTSSPDWPERVSSLVLALLTHCSSRLRLAASSKSKSTRRKHSSYWAGIPRRATAPVHPQERSPRVQTATVAPPTVDEAGGGPGTAAWRRATTSLLEAALLWTLLSPCFSYNLSVARGILSPHGILPCLLTACIASHFSKLILCPGTRLNSVP